MKWSVNNEFSILQIDHVQLAAPKGSEDRARHFFGDILGLKEIEKPEILKKRGAVWFLIGNQQLHIGIEEPFSPAKKAHPAFEIEQIEALKRHLTNNKIDYQVDHLLPGANRIFLHDPFGNRIELLEWE